MDEERKAPVFLDAPGCVVRPRLRGWAVTWQCRTDIALAGFKPRSFRILIVKDNPTEQERAFVSDRCNGWQREMLNFAGGGIPQVVTFDGTVEGLIGAYKTDPYSRYKKLRYVTRRNYQAFFNRIIADHGNVKLSEIKARDIIQWYEEWLPRGQKMARGLVTLMRVVVSFGIAVLEDPQCKRIKEFLEEQRYEGSAPRVSVLTYAYAKAIIDRAHEKGLHSIALAQAIAFDVLGVRQKDIIGEWIPQSEPELSDILVNGMKWVRGIRWEQVDDDLMLSHVTSKRGKKIVRNLKLSPMVMDELERIGLNNLPKSGPIIVCETTGRAYSANIFRRNWRKIATEVGVPKSVWNMDSRAGAATESTNSGSDIHHVQVALRHSNVQTTQGYSRDEDTKADGVQARRVEFRNKTGTGAA